MMLAPPGAQGLDERRSGIERCQAGNAPLHGGATDLVAVAQGNGAPSPSLTLPRKRGRERGRSCSDLRDGIDDEVDLSGLDDIDDVGMTVAQLLHHSRGDA